VNIVWISDWYTDAIIAYGLNYLWLKPKEINRNEVIDFLKNYSLSANSKTPIKSYSHFSVEKLSIIKQVIEKFWKLDINHINWKDLVWKNIDLFTYSFPCQDISQQWKQKGFSKWVESRSWLLWQVERILQEIKQIDKTKLPKILMMENVKAILNEEFKTDLNLWVLELEKLWYKTTKPFVVNSSDVGSAQNRSRVFMISSLGNNIKEFELKDKKECWSINQILQKNLEREIFKTEKNINIIKEYWSKTRWLKKWFIEWYTTFNAECYVYHKDWQAPTITASWAQSRIKYFDWNKIFYLNSLEHLLLQWFDKYFYTKLKDFWFTENKIKFLAWNSINVKVLEEIFKFYLK
jgi:DNA (cytosine-5)-methyltransferase 1